MTLLVKNEEMLIRSNLDFHLAQGVDKIIVTDNGSTDSTPEILKEYTGAGLIDVIEEPSKAYHQKAYVNRMVRHAIKCYDADWIINADADEFFYSKTENLKDALPADCKPNILFCQWRLALPRAGQHWRDIDNFHAVELSKAIHHTRGFRSVSGGNHRVYLTNVYSPAMTEDIVLYHLQSRDFHSYQEKLRSKYQHCQYTREKSFPEELREPYEAMCLQGENEARIFYDGMIEKAYDKAQAGGEVIHDIRFSQFLHKVSKTR